MGKGCPSSEITLCQAPERRRFQQILKSCLQTPPVFSKSLPSFEGLATMGSIDIFIASLGPGLTLLGAIMPGTGMSTKKAANLKSLLTLPGRPVSTTFYSFRAHGTMNGVFLLTTETRNPHKGQPSSHHLLLQTTKMVLVQHVLRR
jgi:hypothetical protein